MKKFIPALFALVFIMLGLCETSFAQCISANAIYVTPGGTGPGTASSPTNLLNAIQLYQANNAHSQVYMQGGNYRFYQTINLPSGIKIEGAYDDNNGTWTKNPISATNITITPPFEFDTDVYYIGDTFPVAGIIGIKLNNVSNIALTDININVYTTNNLITDRRDGFTVYAIYCSIANNIRLLNMNITTGNAEDGGYGLPGRNGTDAIWEQGGGLVLDNVQTTNAAQPIYDVSSSSTSGEAGGAGGWGGPLQQSQICQGPSCVSNACQLQSPPPAGGNGGQGGGVGGACGEACHVSCYIDQYENLITLDTAALNYILADINEPSVSQQGVAGRNGNDGRNGLDGDQYNPSLHPLLDQFFIPGKGGNAQDGAGGGGGGGGGAGGITVVWLPPLPPGVPPPVSEGYSVLKASLNLAEFAAYFAGTDICNASIMNLSTPGGAGGGGGEGGKGGGGGGGGGGNFGIYAYASHGIATGNVTYNLGQAGTGGTGGQGGFGGYGAPGVSGPSLNPSAVFPSFQGALGGSGGNGGNGGNGGTGSAGFQYQTIGLNDPIVFAVDSSHMCTNSYIGLIHNSTSNLQAFFGHGNSLPTANVISQTPTYTVVSVPDTGTLQVIQSSGTYYNIYTYDITQQRPLPSFTVPSLICPSIPLALATSDSSEIYLWQVYLNGNLVAQSQQRSWSFLPADTSNDSPNYTVTLQEYSSCCGWSVAATHSFTIEPHYLLSISLTGGIIPPYCQGADSSVLTLTGVSPTVIGTYPNYIYTYPGVTWSTGDTSVNTIKISNNGTYSVTYVSPNGCITHSQHNYTTNSIFPVPQGMPVTPDVTNVCYGGSALLQPVLSGSVTFNFYNSPNNQFTLPGGSQTPYYQFQPNFGYPPVDSMVVYVVALNEFGCPGPQRGTATIYRSHVTPYVLQPFTNLYRAYADGNCGAYIQYQIPQGVDYCGNPASVVFISGQHSGAHFPLGISTVLYRVYDYYNDSTDVPITIIVSDTTPPTLYNVPVGGNYNTAAGTCAATNNFLYPTAIDNCSGTVLSQVYHTGIYYGDSLFGLGTTNFYFAYSDSSGNYSRWQFTVNVHDNQPPVLTCPHNQTYYVGPRDTSVFVAYNAPTVWDNCDTTGGGMLPWKVSGFPQFGYHGIGTTTQVWADTDKAGNMGTCSFDIMVLDTIKPVITCPGNYLFDADTGLTYATVTYPTPTAIDVLGAPVTITLLSGKASGDTASLGTYTSVWRATDIYNNSATCAVNITIASTTPPRFLSCPHSTTFVNQMYTCSSAADAFNIGYAVGIDGHVAYPYLVSGLPSGSQFPVGVTTEIYAATDDAGNTGYCTFTITVLDTLRPLFTNCGDTTVDYNPSVCGGLCPAPQLTGITFDCSSPRVVFYSGNTSDFYPLGTSTQVYRIYDGNGNYNTCNYQITVVDNNNPTAVCPPDVTVNSDPGQCTAYIPNIGQPRLTPYYSPSCIWDTVITVFPDQHTFPIGTTSVQYRTNIHNEYAPGCTWHVTVIDASQPSLSNLPNITQLVNPGACGNVVNFTPPVPVGTICSSSGVFLASGLAPGSFFPIGTTLEQYVVSDVVSGRSDTSAFTVTIIDTIKPTLTLQADIIDSTSFICGTIENFTTPVGADNSGCFHVYLAAGIAPGSTFPLGTTHEVWVVRDSSGNADTTSFNVTINPIYPLSAGCIDNWVQSDPNGNGQIIYYPLPGNADHYTNQITACPGVTTHLLSGIGDGGFFTPGPHNEVYQFVVNNTNDTVYCTTTVIDAPINLSPTINCGTQQFYYYPIDTTTCSVIASIPQATATESYNPPITITYTIDGIQSIDSVDTFTAGYHVITYTATDYFGARSTCTNYIDVTSSITVSPDFLSNGNPTYCQNESVTLNPDLGGNLTGATYMWIGYDIHGNLDTVSTDSALHFNSIQPSDANQYHFIATDRCGASAQIGEFSLRVTAAPTTTLTGLDSAYCVSDSTNYTISYSPAGGILSGYGLTGNQFNPHTVGYGPHTITYSYTDTVTGCTGISSITVMVSMPQVVTPFADTIYCINATPIQLPVTNSTYTGAGISGTVFTPSSAGSGNHLLTRIVSAGGCTTRLSENVRVNSVIPNATITAPLTICQNSGLHTLTAATRGGAWAGTYLSTDSVPGRAQFNSRAAGAGIDTIIYTITQSACTSSDTAVITLLSSAYNLPYTFPQICLSGAPVLFDTTNGKRYQGIGFNNNVFYPDSVGGRGAMFYLVITTNNLGCQDTNFRMLNVQGGQLDVAAAQYVCNPGDSVFINLGNQYDSISWYNGSHSNQLWFTDTGSYRVFLRDTAGCYGLDTLTILPYTAPAQIVTSASVYACPSDSAIVTAVDSFMHYTWNTGDTTKAIEVLPGSYNVTVTSSHGCKYTSPQVIVSTGPDTVPPVITCPNDTILYAPAGSCSITGPGLGTPVAFDNCALASVSNNAPLSLFVGVTDVTWTAVDNGNNHATCVQHVTVRDTIRPYFTTTPQSGFIIDTSQHTCVNPLPGFTGLFAASDSCSSVTISQQPAAGTLVTSGITPVTITATDISGNSINYYLIYKATDTIDNRVSPTVLVSALQNPVCAGYTDTISASVTNGGNSPVYLWLLNNLSVNTNGGLYVTDSLRSSDVIKCVLISNAACATTDTVTSGSLSVTVNPVPTAVISPAGPVSFCQGDSSQLTVDAGNTYLWSTTATTQDINVTATGSYTVTITNSNNCSAVSSPVSVTANPLPGVPVITQSHDTLISSVASTYQWYFNGTAINGATGRTIVITNLGNYTVEVTDNGGCSNTSVVLYVNTLSVATIAASYQVQLYPNPNNGNFILQFSDNITRYVWLTDLTGRSITTSEAVNGQKDFDVSTLSSGVYLLEIMDENGLQTLRVVVQK